MSGADQKVEIATIHIYYRAFMWHEQFLKRNGENVQWLVYTV